MKLRVLILALFIVQSCAVYPKSKYDIDNERCQLRSKKLTFGLATSKHSCKGSGTASATLCLITASTIGVATAIVSGSIVLVGNTAHWLEKQGKCENSFLNRKIFKHNKPLLDNEGVLVTEETES